MSVDKLGESYLMILVGGAMFAVSGFIWYRKAQGGFKVASACLVFAVGMIAVIVGALGVGAWAQNSMLAS